MKILYLVLKGKYKGCVSPATHPCMLSDNSFRAKQFFNN